MSHYPAFYDGEPWGLEARVKANNILRGKLNCMDQVTLTANSATTTITDEKITDESVIGLMPMTANAAAALGTTYFNATANGSVVVNHANSAQVDRTYRYTVLG